jgi:hypothetical protein
MALFPSIPALTPEYLDFNIAPRLLSVSGSLTALALLVFLLRAYVRTVMLRFFGVDDAFMLVAVVSGAIPSAVALSTHGWRDALDICDRCICSLRPTNTLWNRQTFFLQ